MWRDPETGPEHETFQDKDEAELWKRLLNANGQSLTHARAIHEDAKLTGPTLDELMETHISELTNVGGYMLRRYRAAVPQHFATLGTRKVVAIRYEDVITWIKYMQGKGLSAKTIANHHGFLSATMSTAVRKGIRPDNPCKGVKLPKSTATEEVMRFMTQAEWRRIVESMDTHYRPFFQLLIGTGLRFSEAAALNTADFNFDKATPEVSVTKAWKQDEKGRWFIGPPKTPKSKRLVSLAPSTVEAVRTTVDGAKGREFVFLAKSGYVMRSSSTFHGAWKPALKEAGYKAWESDEQPGNMPRIHDTRHTHASWMLQAGMEIFQLSRRLGHESIQTTADRYSHLLPQAHFVGATIAQKALEG